MLLGNCALEQLAGFAVEEREAEMGGPLAQAVKDTDTVLGIVGGGPGIPPSSTTEPKGGGTAPYSPWPVHGWVTPDQADADLQRLARLN